jgi:hypothetical protein
MMNHVHDLSIEQLLNDADEILRCAKATAYESADSQKGSQRDHGFAVVHLIEMARGKVDEVLRRKGIAEAVRLE